MKRLNNLRVNLRNVCLFNKIFGHYTLDEAEAIGMTKTGTVKYQHILHLVKPNQDCNSGGGS